MSEYVRVRDLDTGHTRSVHAAEVAHGNYDQLDEPAVDPITGDVLPPAFAEPTGKASTKRGQQADTSKES